jgi:hypothetical protein
MEFEEILHLEKKYTELIQGLISDSSFINNLKKIEQDIQNSYNILQNSYHIKQKATSALEKLLSVYLAKVLDSTSVFSLPICSDIALETNDAVIWVDAKAYDRHGNKGDEKSIQIGLNQLTVPSSVLQRKEVEALDGSNFIFPGFKIYPEVLNIYPEAIYGGKPILTFVIALWSYDNGNNFEMKKIDTATIPHLIVDKNTYSEELHTNVKGYHYLGEMYKNDEIFKPYVEKNIPKNFKIINYVEGVEISKDDLLGLENKTKIAILDLENFNPWLLDKHCIIRKFKGKKWRVTPYPESFRISKEVLVSEQAVGGISYINDWRIKSINL